MKLIVNDNDKQVLTRDKFTLLHHWPSAGDALAHVIVVVCLIRATNVLPREGKTYIKQDIHHM